MLTSSIGPKGPKDFCYILTWQIIRKLILRNSFFKDASLIRMVGLPLKVLFKLSIRNSSDNFQNISKRFSREPSSRLTKYEHFQLGFQGLRPQIHPTTKQNIYFYYTKPFNERLSVAGYRSQNFTNYLSEVKFADLSFGKFSVDLFLLMM